MKFSHAQVVQDSIEFEGEDRTYDVYLPNNYSGTVDFPLLICLHPYDWNGQQVMNYTNFNQVADTSDFLVVYPYAFENWNSGIGDNPNWPAPNVNDVGFIDALIDTLDYHYNIDLARVYVCGFSNGGFMSYKLACELGHRFAAIASVAGVISMTTASNCEPYNTMPVLNIHGTADAFVPINGGATGWYSVDETLNMWIDFNNCLEVDTIVLPDIDPTDGCTVEKISYTNCTNNSNVIHYKVINGGHTWPGAGESGQPLGNTNQDIHASVEIWNFFKNYPESHCLPEGITFSSQDEIDNFQTNYPDCTEVEGDVTINGDDINNLNGLDVLYSIAGNLTIYDNDSLTSLTGLENLIIIQGDLAISGHLLLETLTGLNNLNEIEGNLSIGYEGGPTGNLVNQSLLNLIGLDNLHTIGGGMRIGGNHSLSSLTGLNNLQTIGADLHIVCNHLLKSLSGLDNLNNIGGIFKLGWHPQGISWTNNYLKSFNGLGNLSSIGGGIVILNCDSLENFEGLETLSFIGGGLHISYNNLLDNFQGLENLTTINGHINIGGEYSAPGGDNPSLTSLSGLDNIDAGSIGNLHIKNNSSLSTCNVQSICDYLAAPYGTVVILDNATGCNNPPEIADACGNAMPCLPYGNYYFNNQADIDSFQSNYPGCIQLEGDVIISGNNITNLNGLNEVTSISGNLLIRSNPSLTDLIGLESLYSIGGDFEINFCDSLKHLTGIDNLTSLAGDIIIGGNGSSWGNPSLVTLSGLDNLDAGTINNIKIRHNSSLSDCDAQSICDYLASPNGTIVISDNAPGCNNQQEVQDDCDSITSVSEFITEETFTISPNPLESTTLIQYTIPNKSLVTIKIIDLTGVEIKTLVNEIQQQGKQQIIFNTGNLPTGIYFCVLKTNNGIQTRKIIKL